MNVKFAKQIAADLNHETRMAILIPVIEDEIAAIGKRIDRAERLSRKITDSSELYSDELELVDVSGTGNYALLRKVRA